MSIPEPSEPGSTTYQRWVGEATRHMEETVRRFDGVHRRLDLLENKVTALQVEVIMLKTKVGIYSAIGAIVGGAVVTGATQFIGGQ